VTTTVPAAAASHQERQGEHGQGDVADTACMCAALVVPALEAGPFRLRPFMLGDLDVVREASADPLIPLITTVPAAFTQDEGRRYIERQWSRAEQGTGYSFAIADAVTDRAVGQAGLWLSSVSEGRASVGYWVAESGRGRRAAAFAVRALVCWGHQARHIPRLELYVEPWNTASIRTAERAGFQREGLLRGWQEVGGERKDMFMYGRLSADPLPQFS
jgi:[ribosomal protein S5]-alanine N-acetyltransferase